VKNTGLRPRLQVTGDGQGLVSRGGALLLTRTARATGLDAGLSAGLARWRAPRAVHDPGKAVLDMAVMVAAGGDCLADAAMLRAEPELFGPVASGPVISRLVSALAGDQARALKAIRGARAAARQRAWQLAGPAAPGADGGLVTVDLDATVVIAHSEKENAAPTCKKTFGFHPLCAFADHGAEGTGRVRGRLDGMAPVPATIAWDASLATTGQPAARSAAAPPGQRHRRLARRRPTLVTSPTARPAATTPARSTLPCTRRNAPPAIPAGPPSAPTAHCWP
jgi:hypothetical protein